MLSLASASCSLLLSRSCVCGVKFLRDGGSGVVVVVDDAVGRDGIW